MLTKGIVEEIITPYRVKVRIPIFNSVETSKNFTPTDSLDDAIICTISNSSNQLKIGDVVIVGFEDNDTSKPIVLGLLGREIEYSETDNDTYLNRDPSVFQDMNARLFNTYSTTHLYKDTYIGEVKPQEILNLKDSKGNIQEQLDNIATIHGYVDLISDQTINGEKTFVKPIIAPSYKNDTTVAALKVSDSNELNFSSNVNTLYIGYSNRLNSPGVVDTYYFGTHSGTEGSKSGTIYAGNVYSNNSKCLTSADLDALYPVGTIYFSTEKVSPASIFGGTWEKLTSDAYFKIIDQDASSENDSSTKQAGKYAGTSSEHKIPIESMPSHNHTIHRTGNGGGDWTGMAGSPSNQWQGWVSTEIGYTGGGQAYYPYYYGVYAWRRQS